MTSSSAKMTLISLFGLFLLPLTLAWLMYSGIIDFHPQETSNRGKLVKPPLQARWPEEFDSRLLGRRWLAIYPVSLACEESCREMLTGLRQIKRALGRDGGRLRLVVLSGRAPVAPLSESVAAIDPEIVVIEGAIALEQQLGKIGTSGSTFIVDPLGNIMMQYSPGTNANDIRHDLDRLLKYGKTDPQ